MRPPEKEAVKMKKLLFALLTLGAISAYGQAAFDGTWRLNPDSAQIKGNDKYSVQDGMYRCETCVPKIAVKADGQDHKVSGSPYTDTTKVTVVDDHTVDISSKKGGKPAGTMKMTVSDDGKMLTTEWSFISERQGGQRKVHFRAGRRRASRSKQNFW
jgi:hypothetical protein